MPGITLEIPQGNVEFYVASLARGVLMAMQTGAIGLEAGVWSLGRPVFQQALQGSISTELRAVLQAFDELDALKDLGGDVDSTLERLLSELDACQRRAATSGTTDFLISTSQA